MSNAVKVPEAGSSSSSVRRDPQIEQALTRFHRRFDVLGQVHSLLGLDETWPSIATLNLLTFSMRLKKSLDPDSRAILHDSAVYVARIAEKCWSKIATQVRLTSDGQAVLLRATGGKYIPEGASVELDVTAMLADVLKYVPDPLLVTRDFERRISFDINIVSLACLGAVTGLGPSVRGAWSGLKQEQFAPALQEIQRELAMQCADYYARTFPSEPLGAVAELYLSSLVFPPLLCNEELPAANAINQILDFADAYKIGHASLKQLAGNLAQTGDDTMSCAGLALYAALADEVPPPKILAACQAKSRFMGLLRHASATARARLGGKGDWVLNGLTHGDRELYRKDEEMLLIPWLYMPFDRLLEKELWTAFQPLLLAMCSFDHEESLRIADKLVEEAPGDIDLRLQRIKLTMAAGDHEAADGMFRRLLSEPEADTSTRFFHLWTLSAISRGDMNTAAKYSRTGLAIIEEDDPLYSELCNNAGWALLVRGELEPALEMFERGLVRSLCPVTLLLNKVHCLWRLNRHDECADLQSKLAAMAPNDLRVFSGIPLARGD